METTDLLEVSGMSATGVAIILIVYRVIKSLRGKKFVSSCCGKKAEVGFDVKEMGATPPRINSDNKIPTLDIENVRQSDERQGESRRSSVPECLVIRGRQSAVGSCKDESGVSHQQEADQRETRRGSDGSKETEGT